MNSDASLYHRSNDVQRKDAKEVMEEFGSVMQWRTDGQDTLLDIGCGSGDVTMDYILPKMPKNFKKLVGADISEDMVHHARKLYANSKISFDKLNIGGEIKEFLVEHPEGFDHITSLYCLHWERNQKQAVKNIYDLLKTQGDCLLVALANHPIFDVYKELSQNNKWNPFMKNVDRFITPYQYREDPAADLGDFLRLAGFSEYNVQIAEKTYIYDGLSTLKRNVCAINPFLVNMTTKQREEFFEDYLNTIIRMEIAQKKVDENDYRFITSYKLIIAYAKKSN